MKVEVRLQYWGQILLCLEELGEGTPLHLTNITTFLMAAEALKFTVHLKDFFLLHGCSFQRKIVCVFCQSYLIFLGGTLTKILYAVRQITPKMLQRGRKYKHYNLRSEMVGKEERKKYLRPLEIQEERKMEEILPHTRNDVLSCFPENMTIT